MGIFVWALKNWKLLAGVALLVMAFVSGKSIGESSVQTRWDSEKAALLLEAQKKSAQDAKKILELETAKNENLKRIDGLLANNHALWLRLPKTPCGGPSGSGIIRIDPPQGGVLHGEPPDPLTEYSREVGELFGQCDKIVESCRVNAEYLQSVKK